MLLICLRTTQGPVHVDQCVPVNMCSQPAGEGGTWGLVCAIQVLNSRPPLDGAGVLPDDQDMSCDGFFGTDLHIDICCASAAPRVPAELAGRRESSHLADISLHSAW